MRRAVTLGIALLPVLALSAAAQHGVSYPLHTRVTATVFWIGEPVGSGSTENNSVSAWDDEWLRHYGGVDDPWSLRTRANDYFPSTFTPKENPFYVDLPYNDFDDSGVPRADRLAVVPWAKEYAAELARRGARGRPFSLLKNRWVKLIRARPRLLRAVGGQRPVRLRRREVRVRDARRAAEEPAREELGYRRLAGRPRLPRLSGQEQRREPGHLAVRRRSGRTERAVEARRHHPPGLLAVERGLVRG